jgi:hypothetical protein
VSGFVKEQMAEAQKRFAALQSEAEKALKVWVARGQELQATTAKKASRVGNEVLKKAESFQSRVIQAAGVATQGQIRALNRELKALSKKLDALIEKKPVTKPDARA